MTDTNRPQVVMEREDYAATFELLFLDFKARYKIHPVSYTHLTLPTTERV